MLAKFGWARTTPRSRTLNNHKIEMLDLKSRIVTSLAGNGKPGKEFNPNEPGGLAVLGSTALIADTNNNRIVSYDLRTGRISDWPVTR